MPFVLIIIGAVLLTIGVKGNTSQFYDLVKGDLSQQNGKSGFIGWIAAILIIGSIGYVDELRPLSRAFMGLIIIVLFLANGGVFSQFASQILASTSNAVQNPVVGTTQNSNGSFTTNLLNSLEK